MRFGQTVCVLLIFVTMGMSRNVNALGRQFEPGITLVSTDELKDLLHTHDDLLLINTLSKLEFQNLTIPGSINIPYEHIKEGKTGLPENKQLHLVFFCKGFN